MANLLIGNLKSAALVVGLATTGFVGCNQQRYEPAEWRAAPRPSSVTIDEKESESLNSTDAQRFGQLTPWFEPSGGVGNSTSPRWSTLPSRNNTTLPLRNGTTLPGGTLPLRTGSTLPNRNRSTGTTLPSRTGEKWPYRNGTTLPNKNGNTMPNRNGMTLPARSETGPK